MTEQVSPSRAIHGVVSVPGDKSISHRYAMLASIAEGDSQIFNYSTGADCHSTLTCMKALGTGWGNGVRWRDIEVKRHPSGKPEVALHGRAKEICARLGGAPVHCTITHTDDHAMAVVVIE